MSEFATLRAVTKPVLVTSDDTEVCPFCANQWRRVEGETETCDDCGAVFTDEVPQENS